MPSQPIYRQLVLFDGTDDHTQLFKNIEGLSSGPSNCDFLIFCNESNISIDASLKNLKTASHVNVMKSLKPVVQMLDILHEYVFNYLFILIVGDENAIGGSKLDNIRKSHKHVYIMNTNPSNVTIENILKEIHHCQKAVSAAAMIPNDPQLSSYQCPKCSRLFNSNDLVQKHLKDEHFSIMHNDIYLDYESKILFKKRSDRNLVELNCLACD